MSEPVPPVPAEAEEPQDDLLAAIDDEIREADVAAKEADDGNKEGDSANKEADGTKKEADGANKEADGANKEADGTKKEADGAKEIDDANMEVDGADKEADNPDKEADNPNKEIDNADKEANVSKKKTDDADKETDSTDKEADSADKKAPEVEDKRDDKVELEKIKENATEAATAEKAEEEEKMEEDLKTPTESPKEVNGSSDGAENDDGAADSLDCEAHLEKLRQIAEAAEKVCIDLPDSHDKDSGRKRSASPDVELEGKKPKMDSEVVDGDSEAEAAGKIGKTVKRMTRKELEYLVESILVEQLSACSEVGDLRRRCNTAEKSIEKWKARAASFQKQIKDLSLVMTKFIQGYQKLAGEGNPKKIVMPMKITRSVGLQVSIATGSLQQQQLHQVQLQKEAASRKNVPDRVVSAAAGSTSSMSSFPRRGIPANQQRVIPAAVLQNLAGQAQKPQAQKPQVQKPQAQKPQAPKPHAPTTVVVQKPPQQQARRVVDVVDLVGGSGPRPGVRAIVAAPPRQRLSAPQHLHPAPLPPAPQPIASSPGWKRIPPKPTLKLSKLKDGLVLSWDMDHSAQIHAKVENYQIFAYPETPSAPGSLPLSPSLWKKVGNVKALALPMACTLTEFNMGHKYHFAVRAQDVHKRIGGFSEPQSITLG